MQLVEQHAPAAFANDVAEIRRRVGWILAGFYNLTTCKRCEGSFTFDAVRYAQQRMPPPRTCQACRRRR